MVSKSSLIGKKFGELTVIEQQSDWSHVVVKWKCECSCGAVVSVSTYDLKSHTIDCCGSCKTSKTKEKKVYGKRFEHNGQSLTLKQWSDKLGIKFITLRQRVRHGWSIKDALEKPVRAYKYKG